MRRFFIKSEDFHKEAVTIEKDEARHITKVLRLSPGDKIVLFDGRGRETQATITDITRDSVHVRLDKLIRYGQDPFRIAIGQALLKAHKMDLIIQKATELGIHAIYPFSTQRSVPAGDAGHFEKKRVRWAKIAIESAKQCGRTILPEIHSVQPFPSILKACQSSDLKLIFWEKTSDTSLKAIFHKAGKKDSICALIGPEGGFCGDEADAAIREGFLPVGLGRLILRAETAALAVMTILRYELGF